MISNSDQGEKHTDVERSSVRGTLLLGQAASSSRAGREGIARTPQPGVSSEQPHGDRLSHTLGPCRASNTWELRLHFC